LTGVSKSKQHVRSKLGSHLYIAALHFIGPHGKCSFDDIVDIDRVSFRLALAGKGQHSFGNAGYTFGPIVDYLHILLDVLGEVLL